MIIIDQDLIDVAGFPCSRAWWERFMPEGMPVTVTTRPNGFVTLEAGARGDELAAWIRRLFPRIACAIVPEEEAPYDVTAALDTLRRIRDAGD
jgi:hypothetical protein